MGKGQVAERVKVLVHKVEAAKVEVMAVVPAAAEPVVAAMAALILWPLMKAVVRRPIGMAHQQAKEVVRPWVATLIKWKVSAAERAVLVMGMGQVAERVKVLAHKVEAVKVEAMAVARKISNQHPPPHQLLPPTKLLGIRRRLWSQCQMARLKRNQLWFLSMETLLLRTFLPKRVSPDRRQQRLEQPHSSLPLECQRL